MHRPYRALAGGFAACLVVASLLPAHIRGQGLPHPLQLADSGPRFLSAPTAATPAVDVSASEPFKRTVTVEFIQVPLQAALDQIGRQAQLHFLASREIVPLDRRVSMSATDITVGAALFQLLSGLGLDVQLSADGRVAAIIPRGGAVRPTAARRQGTGTITGHVIDVGTKSPLSQVTIRVEGTSLATTADADGKYAIHGVASGTYSVVARRVGYQALTKQLTVVGEEKVTTLDFALSAAATKLDEVVTTAVGQQRRFEVGNVISTINADSITPTAPITSITDLISARAPGVEVLEQGGITGSGPAIRIRGQSSLVLQSDPIIIVDGIRQDNTPGTAESLAGYGGTNPSPSRLNDLDFNDIETIDVLKGPAASTEYGTDAANGVIVVTTKHGAVGRPQWKVSAEQTESKIPVSFGSMYYSWGHTTDPSHTPIGCPLVPYVYNTDVGSAVGSCVVDSITNFDPLNDPAYSLYAGTGDRGKYDLSVGGGSEAIRYFVSGGLSNETGIMKLPSAFYPEADSLDLPASAYKPNSEQQRSIRTNTSIKLGSTADLSANAAYMSTYQSAPNSGSLTRGAVLFGTGQPPSPANNLGYGSLPGDLPPYEFAQPVSQNTDRLTGGMTANWRPTSWFVGHGTVGIDHGSQIAQSELDPQVVPLYPYVPASLAITNTTNDIYTVDLRGAVTAAVTHSLRSVTSVGMQLVDTRIAGQSALASGITTTNQTLNGAVDPTVTQIGDRQATLGGYADEELGLSDRLFVDGAVRIDAASGFGANYAVAVYPKASVSWLALQSAQTTVRVRAAFGESGVQPPNGSALQLYAPTVNIAGGVEIPTVDISNVQNPNLQPERSLEYEGGFDLSLLHNRVSIDLTGYSKTTHNALVASGTGWELGGLSYEENVGEVRNTGMEGTISATILQRRALTWDVTLNGSVNRNKLVTLAPGVPPQLNNSFGYFQFAAGYPLYGYWAPQTQYADANHDGVLEADEVTVGNTLVFAGSSLPTQEMSFSTHLALWNGAISLNALLDYRGGFRDADLNMYWEATGNQIDYASNFKAPLWEQARNLASQQITQTGVNGGYPPAKGFYEDGTYVRFRELSLTYSLPQRLTHSLRMQTLSLTGAVRNLALWTRYLGVDPEVSSTEGENATLSPTSNTYTVNNDIRADNQAIPLLRYWVIRLNLGL